MRLLQRSVLKFGGVVLSALLMAACGGGDDKSAAAAPQTAAPPAEDNPPSTPPGQSDNSPPTIAGEPGTDILVGQTYTFQPQADDPDGDSLTFSASNLPDWATLDASTGRLSGTPASADVATYSGITIEVSDGTASASLGPFSIAVTDSGGGTAMLSWLPPTQNSDGSTLTDLAGYEVLYGRSQDELNQSISIDNASLSTYVVENLTSGTWYFAVVAVNAAGITSPLSNVASKTI